MKTHPLRQYRESLCISAQELAREAGVSATTIYRIESWSGRAQLPTQRAILETLGLVRQDWAPRLFPWPPPAEDVAA